MNALLLFVKNPLWGHVKTRLAATLGPEKALEVYEYLLKHTRQVALEVPVERWLFYSQSIPAEDAWPTPPFHKFLQDPSPDLGQKMFSAFRQAQEAGMEKALILGSDCFQITPALVNEALARLDETPVVLGPARDGGYYGLGLNFQKGLHSHHLETIFLHKTWSHSNVAEEARASFRVCELAWSELPLLSDVDVEEDIAPIRSHFGW